MDISNYTVLDTIPGNVCTRGKSAGIELNRAYRVKDSDNNICILIDCNSIYTLIDEDKLDYIRCVNGKRVSWFLMKVGYIFHSIVSLEK